ncbi:hypothetical protein SAMN02745181_3849 [Rubritalea squalenifaciens DSM 18772]|uniref:Uncharacterized protein n=1 Tax=Rubritalea squalenifaciens DSM 18772 TaxID=1123071 RepID=A0A1M6SP47_9BACT|nr:hypothetical protein [Rubritalea squalenifaciens]SHK46436.1 hypothetical protein SAMN02745181_3849 [Rubritalea squalenifaciens DSM 18772]
MKKRKSLDSETFAIIEAALKEFKDHGRVLTVTCPHCGSLVEVKAAGSEIFEMKCDCGYFNDTLKGI